MKKIPFLAMAIFLTLMFLYFRMCFVNAGVNLRYVDYLNHLIFAGTITTIFLLIPKLNLKVLGAQTTVLFLYSLYVLWFLLNYESHQPGTIYSVNFFFETKYYYLRDLSGIDHALADLELYLLVPYSALLVGNVLFSKPLIYPKTDLKWVIFILTILASLAMPIWYVLEVILHTNLAAWMVGENFWLFFVIAFLLWLFLTHLGYDKLSKTSLGMLYIAYPLGVCLPYFLLVPVMEMIEGDFLDSLFLDFLNLFSFAISFVFAIGLFVALKSRNVKYLKLLSLVYWVSMFVYWFVVLAISLGGFGAGSV
ncbi:MAG: hypothetical protein JXB08_02755 [Bacilli bacterium]|nr:hypothetical protein [Bacilli bacterium]MBN2877880.1 hypothetical protein [Bacilli bacterium]